MRRKPGTEPSPPTPSWGWAAAINSTVSAAPTRSRAATGRIRFGDDIIYGHSIADLDPHSGDINATLLTNVRSGAVFVTGAPGDDGFVYAPSKAAGDIIRINTNTGAQSTFLNIPAAQFSSGGQRGVFVKVL